MLRIAVYGGLATNVRMLVLTLGCGIAVILCRGVHTKRAPLASAGCAGETIRRGLDGTPAPVRDVRVDHRRVHVAVAEQLLDSAYVVAGLEQDSFTTKEPRALRRCPPRRPAATARPPSNAIPDDRRRTTGYCVTLMRSSSWPSVPAVFETLSRTL